MRQLNFDLKTLQARNRDGAFVTRRDRAYALAQAANLLHALGFRRLRATGLKRKHVNALVAEWQRRGIAVGTVKHWLFQRELLGATDALVSPWLSRSRVWSQP